MPEVDQAVASKLEALFEVEYAARASAIALPDEERRAAKVNAWAAAGCTLDRASEYATLEELEYARVPAPPPLRVPAPPPLRPMFHEATRSPPTSDVLAAADGPGGDGGEAPVTAISSAVAWSHTWPGSRVRPPPEPDICPAALQQLAGIAVVRP